jgi:hypothetical protein
MVLSRHGRVLNASLWAVILCLTTACITQSATNGRPEVSALIDKLSNANVQWDGTPIGLMPTLTGTEANQILEMGDTTVPDLLVALSDPDKYVVAHVILTKLARLEYEAFPAWNGLEVVLAADGSVTIDPAQQSALIERWQLWHQSEPHPTALPPAK